MVATGQQVNSRLAALRSQRCNPFEETPCVCAGGEKAHLAADVVAKEEGCLLCRRLRRVGAVARVFRVVCAVSQHVVRSATGDCPSAAVHSQVRRMWSSLDTAPDGSAGRSQLVSSNRAA